MIGLSTVGHTLLEVGRTARRLIKQLLTTKMMKTWLQWAIKCKTWTDDDWEKVMFTYETYSPPPQGYRKTVVGRSHAKPLRTGHTRQTVKYRPEKCFGMFYFYRAWKPIPSEWVTDDFRKIHWYTVHSSSSCREELSKQWRNFAPRTCF